MTKVSNSSFTISNDDTSLLQNSYEKQPKRRKSKNKSSQESKWILKTVVDGNSLCVLVFKHEALIFLLFVDACVWYLWWIQIWFTYPRFLKLYFKMKYQIECKVLFFYLILRFWCKYNSYLLIYSTFTNKI